MRLDYRVVSVGVLILGACGEDETSSITGPIEIDHLRGQWVAANCDFLVRCGFEPDVKTCRRAASAGDQLMQLIADVAMHRVRYDPTAARKWIDAVRLQRCAIHNPTGDKKLRDAWKPVFVGTLPGGSPCYADDECAGSGVCDKSACMGGDCCAGACASAQPIAVGEACSIGGTPCVGGAHCGPTGPGANDHQCVAAVADGAPCDVFAACKDDQLCDGNEHVCYTLAAPGDPCDPDAQVPCSDYNQYCNADPICAKLPGAGKPCDDMNGPRCLEYAVCVNGTCNRRPGEGEACDDTMRCLGDLGCSDNICKKGAFHVCTGSGAGGAPM